MTPYQVFVELLYEAHGASEAVDRYDLRSDDAASLTEFRTLMLVQKTAFLALITHVRMHADAIVAGADIT